MRVKGVEWLLGGQNSNGGWGGASRDATPSSIEETALAVSCLGQALKHDWAEDVSNKITDAVFGGTKWLIEYTDRGRKFPPAPIGFYFAKLWYFEQLYPLIFTVVALEQVNAALGRN